MIVDLCVFESDINRQEFNFSVLMLGELNWPHCVKHLVKCVFFSLSDSRPF